MPNKSLVLRFPTVPKKYFPHFVRGYFDGDGCVHFKKYYAKDRGKMKWSFSTRFTSGSKPFLSALHNTLKAYGLKGGSIGQKTRGYELVFSHQDSLALFDLMYNNVVGSMFLERKYSLFKKAIATLYPHMRE